MNKKQTLFAGFKVEPQDRMQSTFDEINTLWQVWALSVIHFFLYSPFGYVLTHP